LAVPEPETADTPTNGHGAGLVAPSLRLVVIGGGKMGSAIVGGLLGASWCPAAVLGVVEPLADRRRELAEAHPGVVVLEALASSGVAVDGGAVLAVKPDQAEGVCRLLRAAGVRRVLSVVAGMPVGRLEAALGDGPVVVRAMPNMGALVGAGVTAMSGGGGARAADLEWAEGILSALGRVVRLPERQLDAVTGLSGSGPAYLFLVVEALVEAGVLVGLPRDVSTTLAVETLAGSAALLQQTGEGPEALRAAVTSPGGTTAAGLRVLEARGVRSALLDAVVAATERARQVAY
jgi:pyrroline-5-carboxylate reductase